MSRIARTQQQCGNAREGVVYFFPVSGRHSRLSLPAPAHEARILVFPGLEATFGGDKEHDSAPPLRDPRAGPLHLDPFAAAAANPSISGYCWASPAPPARRVASDGRARGNKETDEEKSGRIIYVLFFSFWEH